MTATTKQSVTRPRMAGPFSIQEKGAHQVIASTAAPPSGRKSVQLAPVSMDMAMATPPSSAASMVELVTTSAVSGIR